MFWPNTRKAFKKIEKAQNILLVTHYQPDGDALSSVCALIDYLKESGKNYYAYCKDQPLDYFYFLPHVEEIKNIKPDFGSFDLVIAADCGDIGRTNLAEEIRQRNKNQAIIEMDHHPSVSAYSDIEIRDTKASATAEIVYSFFKDNDIPINKKRATCILTGISTDTNNFLYSSTSEHTINIASEMLLLGASLPNIIDNTWRNKSLSTMKLWGEAISSLRINRIYNIAYSCLADEIIKKYQATEDELEGIAGFLSNMDEADALLFLREDGQGNLKGSLRTSRNNIDVSRLAKYLGGGGHVKASGFKLKGKIVQTGNAYKII